MACFRLVPGLVALVLYLPVPAAAGEPPIAPDDEIYSPLVESGEIELEARAYHLDGNGRGLDHTNDVRLEAAYSPTGFWRASVEPVLIAPPHGDTRIAEIQFENVFQLLPANRIIHIGLMASYERATVARADDEIELGPIVEQHIGAFAATGEVFGERSLGDEDEYGLNYGWQLAWHTSERFQLALQGFGEREFDDEDEDKKKGESAEDARDSHATVPDAPRALSGAPRLGTGDRLGPALIGTLPWLENDADPGDGLSYRLGVLFGLDHGAANHTLRLSLEYEL